MSSFLDSKSKTPGRLVGRPVGSGGKALALTPVQLRTLFLVAGSGPQGVRNVAFLSILACGTRVSEPCTLTVADVLDPKGRVAESFVLKASNTKNKKFRRVYLNAFALQSLKAYIVSLGEVAGAERLFPLNINYATQLVRKIMHDSGIKTSSHALRRTCATMMSENCVSVRTIMEVLGHASLATTQVYLETSPANISKAINNLKW